MRYPLVPSSDKWENLEPEEILNQVGGQDICDYLNEVIEFYGPPCEFCRYFDSICELGLRKTCYDLTIGPYAEWHIRKFCDKHEGIDQSESEEEELARSMRNKLNCAAQQYGSGN